MHAASPAPSAPPILPAPPAARRRAASLACLLLVAAALLPACSGYQLTGRVVPGATSRIEVVDANDPRLDKPGLPEARISLTLDPQQLNRKHLGSAATDEAGDFALPVREIGAGLLEYDTHVAAEAPDHRSAAEYLRLPGRGKRLLITLSPGKAGSAAAPATPGDFLDETIRMGRPYLTE